jgi:phage shock protein PspC (stress-responsive transcriptional regulator)
MVRKPAATEDRHMTETPSQQQERTRTGIHSDNLRNYERLHRSTTDRKIAGVCGGLGRHLNIDPTILRVLFVVLVFFGGAGLLLYGAAWLVVPEEGTEQSVVQTSPSTRNALLIVVGVVAALLLIGDSWGGWGFPWPLILIAVVALVLLVNRDRPAQQAGPASPSPYPAPSTTSSGWVGATDHVDTAAGTDTDTDTGAGTFSGTTPAEGDAPAPPAPPSGTGWLAPPAYQPPYQPPVRPDRGPKLFGPTLALVAIALGSLGLYDTGHDVSAAAYAALALTVVGVMLLVGSVMGRAGGLIFLGIVATIALAVSSAVDGNWSTERHITRAPIAASSIQDSYRLTAGQIDLDLTKVSDPQNLDGRTITLDAEAGELIVRVPDNVDVDVDAAIRFGGEVDIDGYTRSGNDVRLSRHLEGGPDAPQLTLELDLLVGHIQVITEAAS